MVLKLLRTGNFKRFISHSTKKGIKMSLEDINPQRVAELTANYDSVLQDLNTEIGKRPDSINHKVELVAVSKLKPASDIKILYDHGVRHFGENYVQELIEKSKILPKDIKWHFIGGLQTNKCKDLSVNIPNLFSVETIDTLKKAKKLNDTRSEELSVINVFLQINTSEEEQKSGLLPSDYSSIVEIVNYIINDAKHLHFKGLMCIGSFEQSVNATEVNEDFKVLNELKSKLENEFKLTLELSMGMTNDYKQAIHQGSSYIRVGTAIFGSRPPKK